MTETERVNKTPDNILRSIKRHYMNNRAKILDYKALHYLKKNYKAIYFKKLRLLGMNLFDSQRIIKNAIKNNSLVLDLDNVIVEDLDDFINSYNFNNLYKFIEADYDIMEGDMLKIKLHKHYLLEC